ncbi:MAG: hypothetical protein JSU87_09945 [Gemmatimonadota bacterium]|nr:MAG: hypothetical protein JSU87_09945 [Gemmatimonadota bacterium]
MSAIWIIAGVVALIIAAGVFLYRRGSARAGATAERWEAEAPAITEGISEAEAVEARPPIADALEVSEPEAAVEPKAVEVGPSEEELGTHLEKCLQDSERMLAELREVAGRSEAVAQQVGEGTLDVMGEGLEEVRTLAQRRKLGHAKDKGDALHAQLSLMLQSARREQAP